MSGHKPLVDELVSLGGIRPTDVPEYGPLVVCSTANHLPEGEVRSVEFKDLVLQHGFRPSNYGHTKNKFRK